MKKKRLLVDARCFTGEGQGMRTYIKGLYNAFYYQHPEYDLFFAGYNFEDLRVAFPFLKMDKFIQLKSKSRIKLFLKEFPSVIKSYQIDYAHFQYMTPFIKNCTHIVTTHDLLFLDFTDVFSFWYRIKRKLLFYLSLVRSDIRLTVSNYTRERIQHHFGISPDTVDITPNAVSQYFFQPYNKATIQQQLTKKYGVSDYILYVSRIEQRKNHLLLLESYEELDLATKGKQLVLIGNNTLNNQEVEDKIQSLKIKHPQKVHWIPYVSFEELLKFYQGANLFVFPSKAEGFGIPPIEAGAMGINTLCADNTAMSDFSFFGDNLFDLNDKEAFKRKLLQNIDKPKSKSQLESIAQQIKRTYNWNRSAAILQQQISKKEALVFSNEQQQTSRLKAA